MITDSPRGVPHRQGARNLYPDACGRLRGLCLPRRRGTVRSSGDRFGDLRRTARAGPVAVHALLAGSAIWVGFCGLHPIYGLARHIAAERAGQLAAAHQPAAAWFAKWDVISSSETGRLGPPAGLARAVDRDPASCASSVKRDPLDSMARWWTFPESQRDPRTTPPGG